MLETQASEAFHGLADVVTVGETMAAFVRTGDGYQMVPVGAESNVAIGVAQLGCRSRWVSRLGCDDLGHLVADYVASHGVFTDVEWDEDRPTGVCVKNLSDGGTRMRYYRTGSAASRLGGGAVSRLGSAHWIHLSGVTAALSPSAHGLVEAIVNGVPGQRGRTSFDVNYRPVLWAGADEAARTLLALARPAQLVFVGDDEAEMLFKTTDVDQLRELLITSDDQEVVLKRGADRATLITANEVVSEPARTADVVELTGAGDAFAGGFLAATCWGGTARGRLRAGHFLASRAVGVLGDCGPAPGGPELERLKQSLETMSHDRTDAS